MSIREIRAINKDFNELRHQMELMRDSLDNNTQQVSQINQRAEEVKRKESLEKEQDWSKVKTITDEDRYPMVQTSEPGIKVQTQVNMKKLDIIYNLKNDQICKYYLIEEFNLKRYKLKKKLKRYLCLGIFSF